MTLITNRYGFNYPGEYIDAMVPSGLGTNDVEQAFYYVQGEKLITNVLPLTLPKHWIDDINAKE